MASIEETARELAGIRQLPYGVARTAAAEQAARRIEAEGPAEKLPEALLDLVKAYSFAEHGGDKAFVTFARITRLWDDSPELFDPTDVHHFYWDFKWIATDLVDYPEISGEQAQAFLADMRRRFELAGNGVSSVEMSQFVWDWRVGKPSADEARLRWVSTPRDNYDDCMACTIGQQVAFFTETGRFEEAIALGSTQEHRCNLEPTRTFFAVALASLRSGDADGAVAYYRKARAAITAGATGLREEVGIQFELLARGGQLERALRLLGDEGAGLLDGASSPFQHLRFFLGVLAGLSAAEQPELETGLGVEGAGTCAELRELVLARAQALAVRFDARSGNDYYARWVERAAQAQPSGVRLDLDVAVAVAAAEPAALPEADEADSSGEVGVEDLLAQADALAAGGDRRAAAQAYVFAAHHAEAAGELADAGLAWAEAAHCAQELDDVVAADRYYRTAVPLLRAGDADIAIVVPVLLAWAPMAGAARSPELVFAELAAVAGAEINPDDEQVAPARREAGAFWRAAARDCQARLIGALPEDDRVPGRDLSTGIAAATRAGEEFAALGKLSDAAHAFWVAGRLQRLAGETQDALWSLESAYEGFTMARERRARAEAAGELIELLRETGQDARAEALAAELAS